MRNDYISQAHDRHPRDVGRMVNGDWVLPAKVADGMRRTEAETGDLWFDQPDLRSALQCYANRENITLRVYAQGCDALFDVFAPYDS